MKKSFTLLLIAAAFICYSQSINTFTPDDYRFQDDNELIIPQVDYSKVFIVFAENITDAGISEFETSYTELTRDRSQSYPWHNKKLYSLEHSVSKDPGTAEALLSVIRADQFVLSAYPAFIRDHDIAYLDNILLINMEVRHASASSITEIIEPLYGQLVEELDLISSRTYAISVPAEINIFDACMDLVKHEEVVFAQPNFYFSGSVDFIPNDPMFSDQWFLNQASEVGSKLVKEL